MGIYSICTLRGDKTFCNYLTIDVDVPIIRRRQPDIKTTHAFNVRRQRSDPLNDMIFKYMPAGRTKQIKAPTVVPIKSKIVDTLGTAMAQSRDNDTTRTATRRERNGTSRIPA